MAVDLKTYQQIVAELSAQNVHLVAVSKIKPVSDILQLYHAGQRDFGENYVQELVAKQAELPADIHWHFIGHLQTNKVKYIASFVHLVHGVDSAKLLKEINKQARKAGRTINCLMQVHIASEETKFGMNEDELAEVIKELVQAENLQHVKVMGLMGMASFSDDPAVVRGEMRYLKSLFDKYQYLQQPNCQMTILSMGMSGDYKLAIEEGSNMVRIGSLLFGARL